VATGAVRVNQFDVGSYSCPRTGQLMPLYSPKPVEAIAWAVTVERCSSCGETHLIKHQDVIRHPVLGYE
jgi:hypothetical protein